MVVLKGLGIVTATRGGATTTTLITTTGGGRGGGMMAAYRYCNARGRGLVARYVLVCPPARTAENAGEAKGLTVT